MKRHIKFCILYSVFCIFTFSGCGGSITPEQLQLWSGEIAGISEKIDGYQEATVTAVDTLADKGLIDEDLHAKVKKVSEEIDRVQPTLAEISTAIAEAELTTEEEIQKYIELARAANEASGPVNPYAHFIELGLGGAAAIAAWLAARKNKQAKDASDKYTAHKRGVERATMDLENGTKTAIYDAIGKARSNLGVS